MTTIDMSTTEEEQLTIDLDELERLRRVEESAREAARYHVLGYDCDGAWDANHMLRLLDKLAKVLEE